MTVRTLIAATLVAGAALTAAQPASATLMDTYCVKVAGYTLCTPPTPV